MKEEIKIGDSVVWSSAVPASIKARVGIGPFIVKDVLKLGNRISCFIWNSSIKKDPTSVDVKYLVKL